MKKRHMATACRIMARSVCSGEMPPAFIREIAKSGIVHVFGAGALSARRSISVTQAVSMLLDAAQELSHGKRR